ncbi:hypothetical protein Pcinc_023940 [Petrolisthes cinctipes]|uniref:Uncharacterized protein n=1 Tax=Petrolisthes cinctipes TaxID=88211 RepID=A0AAE1FAX5_PETCI|nr:hypothetical protein Pcinc_023940 [Petrolisthes cinctipes]
MQPHLQEQGDPQPDSQHQGPVTRSRSKATRASTLTPGSRGFPSSLSEATLGTHPANDRPAQLLEIAGLRKLPEIRVVVIGGKPDVMDVFLHHSFRNTVHALYLATIHTDISHTGPRLHYSMIS